MNESNGRNTVWQGKYLQVVVDRGWQFVQRPNITGIVAILPLTVDNEIVLIEQERVPVHARVLEMPAGLVGDEPGKEDEDFATAARRELLEETGYEAGTMEYLFEGVVSAGLTDERLTYFLARDCRKVGPGGGDGSEDITVHVIPLDQVLEWAEKKMEQGLIIDVKAMSILYFWLNAPQISGVEGHKGGSPSDRLSMEE